MEGVAFALAAHVATREPVQLIVDQRVQLIERGLVPFAPFSEQLGDLVLGRCSCQIRSCLELIDVARFSEHLVDLADVELFFRNHAARVVFE